MWNGTWNNKFPIHICHTSDIHYPLRLSYCLFGFFVSVIFVRQMTIVVCMSVYNECAYMFICWRVKKDKGKGQKHKQTISKIKGASLVINCFHSLIVCRVFFLLLSILEILHFGMRNWGIKLGRENNRWKNKK